MKLLPFRPYVCKLPPALTLSTCVPISRVKVVHIYCCLKKKLYFVLVTWSSPKLLPY